MGDDDGMGMGECVCVFVLESECVVFDVYNGM